MRSLIRRAAVAFAVVGAVSLMSFAAPVRADGGGATAFYFAATCTGLGDVILTNAGPSHTAALQVLGTTTVVLVPASVFTNPQGVPGLAGEAAAQGTTCTLTAGGYSPDQLVPFDQPVTRPVVIIG
jgi:hypothetical protein